MKPISIVANQENQAGGDAPKPVKVDDLVQAIVKANREKMRKTNDRRQRGRRKVQSVVDRILSGKD